MSLNWLRGIGHLKSNRSKPNHAKPGRRWRSHLRLEILEDRRLPSIFTVLNTNDSGNGSLRQAILDANRGPFTNTIAFDIGGGRVQTIMPTSALPTITNHVVIDGTTQPGFAGSPLIVLNGSHAGADTDGLTITAGSSTVQALVINGFSGSGIDLMTNGGNVIVGDYIGTDATGTMAVSNGGAGVLVQSNANVIGGTSVGARNLISGNTGYGISISGSENIIQGSFIGTDIHGTHALGNGSNGVEISGGINNTVGGTTLGARNLISANTSAGVAVVPGAEATLVQGNLIGTDITGTQSLGNLIGVSLETNNNTVGGTATGDGNLISGNAVDGIRITGQHNVIQGNFIGVDLTGSLGLGNPNGLYIQASNNTIGGTLPGAGNLISGNSVGVSVRGTDLVNAPGDTIIEGNFIGTDVTGTERLGNGIGVNFELAFNNTVGGTLPGAGNLISGNGMGISIAGQFAPGNQVVGNLIGTDVTGTAALGNILGVDAEAPGTLVNGNVIAGNSTTGLLLEGYFMLAQGNLIGVDHTGSVALGNGTGVSISVYEGRITFTNNVVSGNQGDGIRVQDTVQHQAGAVVQHNWIGTDATGSLDLGNAGYGIRVSDSGDTIGGTSTAAGNIIAFNGAGGVLVDRGTGNAILRNRIFGHDNGLGIELVNGGNQNQAFPTLTSAVFDGSTTTITGILTSSPDTTYTVELFVNSVCNPSGFGEGEQFFASLTVATDANGNASFTLALPVAVDPGQFIAATATDPHGNTSEFSQCLEVTAPGQAGLSVAEFHEAVLPAVLGLPLSGEPSFDSPSGTPAIPSVFLLPGDLGAAPLNRTVGQEGSDLFFGTDAPAHSEMDGFMDRVWDELTIQNSFFD